MPETVFYCNKVKSICVDSFGEVVFEDVENSIHACLQLFEQYDTKHLIVDVSKQVITLDYLDTFEVCMHQLPQLPTDLKMAYIINDPPQQPHRFFHLISSGVGYTVKLFTSIEGAVKWLKEDDEVESLSLYEKIDFPSAGLNDLQ